MCLTNPPDDDPQDEDFGRVQEDRSHRSEISTSDCVFGEIYAPQSKILEGRTDISEGIFEALFKGEYTVFGKRIAEKVLRKHVLKGWFVLPKSSFGEHKLSN